MTTEIALVLAILLGAVVLFVTERIKMDVVALLVLVSLAVTGLVTPTQALSGFSNPAVITVLAMFMISGGLSRTGVANQIGRQVLRLAGDSEGRLIVVIMSTAAVMSAFMNNVGVAAMMLPVVMDIARRIGRSPSRLLMPLAGGALLGGLTTLIGTPPNLLISDALRDAGLTPFGLFDYAPVGGAVLVAGILFMFLGGRNLLPQRVPAQKAVVVDNSVLSDLYDLRERLFLLHVPQTSPLAGKSLRDSRLGTALRLNVVAISHNGQLQLAPGAEAILRGGDRLVVQGRTDLLKEVRQQQYQTYQHGEQALRRLLTAKSEIVEATLAPGSSLVGQTLYQSRLRQRFGVTVLALRHEQALRRASFQNIALRPGERLLVLGGREQVEALRLSKDFVPQMRPVDLEELIHTYRLHERMLGMRLTTDSYLRGKTLAESRLGDAWGLFVLAIMRDVDESGAFEDGEVQLAPSPEATLQAGDTLLLQGRSEDLQILRGLQSLVVEPHAAAYMEELESSDVGLAEVILSPHSTLVGQTLRQIRFRDKFDLSVLAIWRGGRAYRSNLRDMTLGLGDALLVYGSRQKIQVLGSEPDFLVLTEAAQEPLRLEKAPLAALIMVAMLLPVFLEWLPIAIAGVMGATLMILLGCLTIEEAYRYVELRAIFLIAGMLPLGIAMEQTGAANFIAQGMIGAIGGLGPTVILAGLFVLTTLATQVMPNPAVAVLMAPIALNTASDLGLSPYALMMTVAIAASASFLSPVSHPANVLIMGPGGYRFSDYLKVGLPLTLVVLVVTLLVLPLVWPV